MTLPLFQVPLPAELKIKAMELTPMWRNSAPAQFPDGFTTLAEVGDAYWQLKVMATATTLLGASKLRAWKAMLRGGQKTFVCPYGISPFPMAYASKAAVLALTRAGGGAFNGNATIQTITSVSEITFGTSSAQRLPANFALSVGDVISVVKAGARPKYSLHFVVEAVVASATGVATVTIEPRLNSMIFAAGDVVQFVDPVGEFTLDPAAQQDGLVTGVENSFQLEANSYLRA